MNVRFSFSTSRHDFKWRPVTVRVLRGWWFMWLWVDVRVWR